jgi:hypothetical protein
MSTDTFQKRMAGLAKARAANAQKCRERHARHDGQIEVCFKLPTDEYRMIQRAAEREHRSASNYMWHHAAVAAAASK